MSESAAELLELVDAPEALIGRARAEAWEIEDAWDRVDRGDHRLWLSACAGAPIEQLIEAAALAVWVVLERSIDPPGLFAQAAELAVSGATAAELRRVAQACEELAQGGGGTYRSGRDPGFEHAARAAALVARAAEGLVEGEARREAVRLERARRIGAVIGIGAQSALPSLEGPARLQVLAAANDPAQGAFLFATAAAAEVALECVEALSAGRPGARAEAVQAIDDVIRGAFEGEEG